MTLHKPTIFLTIEIKSREFLPKCFLAYKLFKKGFRVYLGSHLAIKHYLKYCDPSLIFHKSTWYDQSRKFKDKKHSFVFLDEEGGPTIPRDYIKRFYKDRYNKVNALNQDMIFLPSERIKNKIKNIKYLKNIPLIVTGWPRADLWFKKFNYIHNKQVAVIKKKYDNFYLFVSSFGFNDFKSFEYRLKDEPKIFKSILFFRYKAFNNYIKLLKELSKIISINDKIIIRPHPNEDVNIWKKLFENYQNIIVEIDKEIDPWILASQNILTFGSTIAIQACLQNKVCVQYKVEKKRGITDSPSYELCVNANSANEVYRLLKSKRTSHKVADKLKIFLKKDLAYTKNKLATDKIVEEILSIDINKSKKFYPNIFNKFCYYIKYSMILISGFLCKYKIYKPNDVSILNKLPNGIRLSDVKLNIDLFCKKENDKKKITYSSPIKDLVCLE